MDAIGVGGIEVDPVAMMAADVIASLAAFDRSAVLTVTDEKGDVYPLHALQVWDANADDEVYLMHTPWDEEATPMTAGESIELLGGVLPRARVGLWIAGVTETAFALTSLDLVAGAGGIRPGETSSEQVGAGIGMASPLRPPR